MTSTIYSILQCLIIIFVCSLTFRIRGGLRIPGTDKKFPLNKWWFAVGFTCCACWLTGNWTWSYLTTGLVAAKMCTSISGWGGQGIGPIISGKVSEDDFDDLNITDFVRNKIFKFLNLDFREHGRLYGVIWLSFRGALTTFILGLAINSIFFMPVGFIQGPCYWLATKANKSIDLGTGGWNWGELIYPAGLGLFLFLCLK